MVRDRPLRDRRGVHRVHYFTNGGAICGALRVLEWSAMTSVVTCPQCLARMDRTPTKRREAFESFFPAARLRADDGELP